MAEGQQLQIQNNSYTPEQIALIEKKGLAWKELGEGAAKVEMQLIEDATAAIKRISKLPETIDDVSVAEATLKNVNSEYLRIEEDRSVITKKFDALITRFMAPSKSMQPHIVAYRTKIIEIKTEHEKKEKAIEEKRKEIAYVKEYLLNQVNSFDAGCKTKITNMITSAYAYALGAGNIGTVDSLKSYLDLIVNGKKGDDTVTPPKLQVAPKLSAKDFIYNPTMPKLVHVSEQEYAELLENIDIPTDYVKLFHDELNKQFFDYETAWHNKETALANQRKEAAEKEKAIADELLNKNVAAKLEAVAVPVPEQTGVKALKKSYAIDMEENKENAMKIMAAFIANFPACCEHIRLKNWFNISPTNMIGALQKLKNEDNAFEVTGIVWKEVAKL